MARLISFRANRDSSLSWSSANGMFVRIFNQIGLGQWFRYFTGALQIAGGILLIMPRTALIGAGVLACTLVGAIIANVFVLRTGLDFLFPAILLAILAAVVRFGRPR